MSLTIDNHSETARANAGTMEKVTAYLNGLYYATNGVPLDRRDAAAETYMKNSPPDIADKSGAVKRIDDLTRECESDARSVSWRTKINSRFGKRGKEIVRLATLGAATAVGGVLAANGMPFVSSSVLFAGLVAIQGKNGLTDKEKADVEQYRAIKHGLFALKKMRQALMPESDGKSGVSALDRNAAIRLKRNRDR